METSHPFTTFVCIFDIVLYAVSLQRLFEKLNDSLVKPKTRLSSLIVLGYIIRQEVCRQLFMSNVVCVSQGHITRDRNLVCK